MADFDYHLPEAAIAQHPIEPRDAARLLVDQGPGAEPQHRTVRELPGLLQPGDLVVLNETKVIPARLVLRRATGGGAEVLLLEALDDGWQRWEALVRPSRRLRDGERLAVVDPRTRCPAADAEVTVGPSRPDGTREVWVQGEQPAPALLERYGRVPLPPYISAPLADPDRYQTVYATRPGSVAAPTAGLHLTPEVLAGLGAAGVRTATVELVVGLDTFRPVTADDPADHPMHTERYHVPEATAEACAAASRVVAVGTTVVRALESAAARGQAEGRTDLFIRRPYPWQVVDLLLTNFHLPRTTLLLLVDAFVGPRWRDLYATALAEGYRFLSFGDAMLLRREGE